MNDTIRRAIDAVNTPGSRPGVPLVTQMQEKRNLVKAAMDSVLDTAEQRKDKNLTASESRSFDIARAKIVEIDGRIAELEELAVREAAADETRRLVGGSITPTFHTSSETYHRGENSPSYFRDLRNAQRGDYDAMDRLRRNNQERGLEARALGNTGGTGGSGGEFAPPGWLVEEWVQLARPGRVTADLFHHEVLPTGVSSVNIPKVSSGTSTLSQTSQNTTLSNTDMTTASLSSNIVTIGGRQVVSQQLLDQSGTGFDKVVLDDLAADYAKQIGTQVLTGSGTSGALRGYLTPSSTNVVTWTQATPTAPGFYSQLGKLQSQINASRFRAPDAVVMSPRRWGWFASYTDSAGRPLVVPTAGGYNALATPGAAAAAGHVGSVLGMDVYVDPNLPLTLGAGTNQDVVLCFVRDDIWLWESDLRVEAFNQPYSDSMAVLFRVFNYAAMIPDRYMASLGQLSGTGLVTPTFAS
jgi:HK97 family phage major capsid protein